MKETDMKTIQITEERERLHMFEEQFGPHGPGHRHPIPPHERRNMIYVEFNEKNEEIMREMFGAADAADAAISIIHNAPPEIQILALQVLRMRNVELKTRFSGIYGKEMNARWSSPILGQEVNEVYNKAYGLDGEHYVEVLETSPYEIAVISRMIACMQESKGERGE